MDLALNYLQRLICHKTNQTKPNHVVGGLEYTDTTRNEYRRYDIKQSDVWSQTMEICGIWRTLSLSLLSGLLSPGVVKPDKDPIYGLYKTLC